MGTWYTNENDFLESIRDTQTDTFNDLSYDIYASPISRLSSYLSIESSINIIVNEIDSVLTLSSNDDSIITATSHLTNSVGGIFSLHDGNNKVTGNCNIYALDRYNNVVSSYSMNVDSINNFFIGYTSDEEHLSLRLEPEDINLFAGISKIYIGNSIQLINVISVESLEYANSQSSSYSEYLIESNSINTDENINIENLLPQSEIYPYPISSQETYKKSMIWPTPSPGQIYNWYEKIYTIELDLNTRSKS